MKKENNKLKTRLEIGDKVFYYDGRNQWDIETVESVNKSEKYVVLSNNAHISRYPNFDGTFDKLGSTVRPGTFIKKATEELIKHRFAILSLLRIKSCIYHLDSKILKTNDVKDWQRWSTKKQDQLIMIAAHIARAIEEVELDDEDISSLAKVMNEPKSELNKVIKKSKRNKK